MVECPQPEQTNQITHLLREYLCTKDYSVKEELDAYVNYHMPGYRLIIEETTLELADEYPSTAGH